MDCNHDRVAVDWRTKTRDEAGRVSHPCMCLDCGERGIVERIEGPNEYGYDGDDRTVLKRRSV